ncbi:MAG: hypothetical protein KJ971_05340 [Firmicutes bacterium]|nr:hypothetical protein [Bacillota bacterium]
MDNLIRDVIDLDKKARKQVEHLRKEKDKISDFVREERKKLEIQYKSEANKTIEKAKSDIVLDLEKRNEESKKEYDLTLKKLEISFKENKEKWIDSIYQHCIQE